MLYHSMDVLGSQHPQATPNVYKLYKSLSFGQKRLPFVLLMEYILRQLRQFDTDLL